MLNHYEQLLFLGTSYSISSPSPIVRDSCNSCSNVSLCVSPNNSASLNASTSTALESSPRPRFTNPCRSFRRPMNIHVSPGTPYLSHRAWGDRLSNTNTGSNLNHPPNAAQNGHSFSRSRIRPMSTKTIVNQARIEDALDHSGRSMHPKFVRYRYTISSLSVSVSNPNNPIEVKRSFEPVVKNHTDRIIKSRELNFQPQARERA